MVKTFMFLHTNGIVNHMQNTSAPRVSCNNSRLVLKLQLIVESLSIIFLGNDLRKNVHVLFVETLETYIHYRFAC